MSVCLCQHFVWLYDCVHNRDYNCTRKTYGVRVTNLPLDISKTQLRAYFDYHGSVDSVFIVRAGHHGFVNFYSLSRAQEAAENLTGTPIGGNIVECKVNTKPRYVVPKSQEDPNVSVHTVKVSHIAKTTTERTLFDLFSLEDTEDPENVTIVRCPNNRYNHAFVRYHSSRDAQRAVSNLDHECVDGSEIIVKLHTSREAQSQWRSPQADSSIWRTPSATTAKPVQSGTHPKGQSSVGPEPSPARRDSTAVATPGSAATSSAPQPVGEISCSALVASILRSKYKVELEALQRECQVQVSIKPSSTTVRVLGKQGRVAVAEMRVKALKEEVENGIIAKDFNLPCHCVPLFDQQLGMLRRVETDHAVEFYVLRGSPWSNAVDLATFAGEVKQCFTRANGGTGESISTFADLVSYFLSAAASVAQSSNTAQWFYKDDFEIFVEYTAGQSAQLEQMFQTKASRSMVINRNTYNLDFRAMTQSNAHTGRSRAIKREVQCNLTRVLSLRVRGLHQSLDLSIKQLRDAVTSSTIEKDCRLYDDCSESFKKALTTKMRKYFVAVQLVDGRLKLRGIPGYVEKVHLLAEQEKVYDREQQIHTEMGGGRGGEFQPPVHWRPQSEEVVVEVVRPNSEEWNEEVGKVRETIRGASVVRLERIQNKWLWERYSFARKRMLKTNKGHVNEKHLFHGTRGTPPEKVFRSEKGVDFRFSREGLWGTGSYFAVNASYSDAYAYSTPGGINEKQMFICNVLTGDSYNAGTNTDSSLRQPPLKSGHNNDEVRYDSVKGYTNGSNVYVVYDHEKVYPAYLVTYGMESLPYTASPRSYQQNTQPSLATAHSSPTLPKQGKKDSCLIS